jgi:hypothetical protein
MAAGSGYSPDGGLDVTTGRETLFAGLNNVAWDALKHAYGPADDVPEMLRGLVSPDAATREIALDGMEGAVHHQGDVYDSTIAAIPFLIEAAVHPAAPGRDEILKLLASIGSGGTSEPYRIAAEMVAGSCPAYVGLLSDPDAKVRAAIGQVLRLCHEKLTVAAAVSGRLEIEPRSEVRVALVETLGAIAAENGFDGSAVVRKLEALLATDTDSGVRIAAATELARCGPHLPNLVPDLVTELVALYGGQREEPEPVGLRTPTLRSHLREATERRGISLELAATTRGACWAFGDRVGERTRLVTDLLRTTAKECRLDAVAAARDVIAGWRGDYRELAQTLADQLLDEDRRLSDEAAGLLSVLGDQATADALVVALEAAPRMESEEPAAGPSPWIKHQYGSYSASPALRALSRLGDERALPMLGWVLEQEKPEVLNGLIAHFGPAAAALLPSIMDNLAGLGSSKGVYRGRSELIGSVQAIGPAAVEAVPLLRPLAERDAGAAVALWKVAGDPEPALRLAADELTGDEYQAPKAAQIVAELGPVAVSLVPAVRALLERPDDYGWHRVSAATALWRTTGDTETTVPIFTAVWTELRFHRPRIARCLAEMGAAAAPAIPLLRTEIDAPRRHTVKRVVEPVDVFDIDVQADEELLKSGRELLSRLTPPG